MMVGANITGRFDESVFNRTLSCVAENGEPCVLVDGSKERIDHKSNYRCLLIVADDFSEVGKLANGKLILDGENYNFDASLKYFRQNEGNLVDGKGRMIYFNPNTNTFDVAGPVYDEEGNRYYIGIDGKIDVLQTKLYLLYDYVIAKMSETVGDGTVYFEKTEDDYFIESSDSKREPVCFVKTKSGYSIGFVGPTRNDPHPQYLTICQYGKDNYLDKSNVIFSLRLSSNRRIVGNIAIGENCIDISDDIILNEVDSEKLDELIELMLDEASELSIDNGMLERYDETENLISDIIYGIPNGNDSFEQKLMGIIVRINDVSDPYVLLKLKYVFERYISHEFFPEFYTRRVLLSMIDLVNSCLADLLHSEAKKNVVGVDNGVGNPRK